MAEKIIIDDSPKITNANAPTVVYLPASAWRENVICDACNVPAGSAMARLTQTASSGTWTGAAWGRDIKVLSATLDFKGSDIATDFILFYRSGDVQNSTGVSYLRFAIDGIDKLSKQMVPSDYTFQDDFVRQRMFSESNLDPNVPHTLRIQWSHTGTRPPITVALDSIEYTGTLIQETVTSAQETPAPSSTDTASSKSDTAKIVAPTVVAVVAVLALLGILVRFLWLRRQKRGSERRLIVDPDPPYHASEMQPHAQTNWNAGLSGNHPGSMYLNQSFDSNSPMIQSPVSSGAVGTIGSHMPMAAHASALSPPPYADTETASSFSHSTGSPRLYPTPIAKLR